MSQSPPQTRPQFEFGTEENRIFRELAYSMTGVAWMLKIIGAVFLIFLALLIWRAVHRSEGYPATVACAVPTLVFLILGFQTSSAAHNFRRIVETENRDVWFLMNALQSLTGMYKMLKLVILGALVLLGVAVIMYASGAFSSPGS